MRPGQMLAYTDVVAWRAGQMHRESRSRSDPAAASDEWQTHALSEEA